MAWRALTVAAAVVSAACSGSPQAEQPPAAPAPAARQGVTPIGQLPVIDAKAVLQHIKTLASDEFQGRAPGSAGEERAVTYIADQFRRVGLEPGNPDGTYIQKVPLVGITPSPAPMVLDKGPQRIELTWKDEVVAWSKHVADTATLDDSELVFVGYGVQAPEFGWDDYKGADLKGKTLVMLVNDPPVPDPADPSRLDPKTFGGKAMTYYGRWTYKFEMAAEKGAAGAIVVHETGPAGYPFAVVQDVGEKFDLVTPDKNMHRAAIEAWIPVDQARRIFQFAGQDYDALKKQAATRDFKPVPLGVTASMTLHDRLRTIQSRNVVGKIEGGDPALKDEYVVYSAHWDHLGVGEPVNGDRIYNGAVDNASGVAGIIEVARAFAKLPQPPKRSILFLSVTAEEQGLLGSEYYATEPLYPLAKTLADINIDEMNVHGRTRDLPIVGLGNSDLDDYVRAAAAEQGRVLTPDPEPEKGFYYRSDHFNFAKQGVPALDPDPAGEKDFLGKPPEYGRDIVQRYTEHDYHRPSDEVKPDWDLSGAREDLEVLFAVGYRVAQADRFPEWKPGTEFKATRDAMLETTAR